MKKSIFLFLILCFIIFTACSVTISTDTLSPKPPEKDTTKNVKNSTDTQPQSSPLGNSQTRNSATPAASETTPWYSAKLSDGEVYYGRIEDLTTDPIIVKNTYYNYGQINSVGAGEIRDESGNLRLVKKTKDIDSDKTITLDRAEVLYLEGLRPNSMVVQAILEYENVGASSGINNLGSSGWYAAKLVNGLVYYGQTSNLGSNPIIMRYVYYNYDQPSEADSVFQSNESGNLLLVKRGKETHGPDGSMNLVRNQVLSLEPLPSDSKVLKAILDYEK